MTKQYLQTNNEIIKEVLKENELIKHYSVELREHDTVFKITTIDGKKSKLVVSLEKYETLEVQYEVTNWLLENNALEGQYSTYSTDLNGDLIIEDNVFTITVIISANEFGNVSEYKDYKFIDYFENTKEVK